MSDIHKGHRDRLKDLCMSEGMSGLADHVKLEVILFYAIPRVDTNELAHTLVDYFGSFSSVLDAPYEELIKIKGITKNAAVLLKLIPQLTKAYMESETRDITILDTSDKAGKFLVPKFIGHTNEVVYVVSLSTQKRIISCRLVFEGSISTVALPIRRIVEVCIQCGAHSVIVAHNHPGGIPLPSRDDLVAAHRITKALKILDIEVDDHIVVAGDGYSSMGKCDQYFEDIGFM